MWTSFKAFFKSYTVIFVNSYFFSCMHVVVFFKKNERRHVCYNIQRNSIQWIRTRGTEPKSNVWNNGLNDTFRLSCGEKIVIDIKFTTHTTMEIENMKRILNCLDI